MKADLNKVGACVAIGVGVGAAIGVALNNVAIWIPVGVAVGAAIAQVLGYDQKKSDAGSNVEK